MSEAHTPEQNQLLKAFPANVRKRLSPYLKLGYFPLGKVLQEPGHAVQQVYFPIDMIVSLLGVTRSGASAEVSLVGKEGLVGIAAFMGGESATSEALVMSAGHAYSLSATQLMHGFNNDRDLRILMLGYTKSLIMQMAQTAACNRHHSIDQQLSRWLLMLLDRMPGNRVAATQDVIANMLGVRRASVTKAVGKLRKLGVIECKRGQIHVLDRLELEKLSCECYAMGKLACRPLFRAH